MRTNISASDENQFERQFPAAANFLRRAELKHEYTVLCVEYLQSETTATRKRWIQNRLLDLNAHGVQPDYDRLQYSRYAT